MHSDNKTTNYHKEDMNPQPKFCAMLDDLPALKEKGLPV
jgi:hypothetical protein